MTLNDSSSLILIVGAIAILAFVVHGLWFSGRSINRKLVKGSKEDQEIINSLSVGKVRIVIPQSVDTKSSTSENSTKIETFVNKAENKTVPVEKTSEIKQDPQVAATYELNLVSAEGRPYRGLDLEELFKTYGFIRGEKDIYCVYEDPNLKDIIVFRICSLEAPYSFPKKMDDFSTKALALYMQLPPKGKGFIYFKAMRIAANCLVEHLGGTVYDNDNKELTADKFDKLESELRKYDKFEE
ncbi:MAG: hypothetical protein GX278_00610 [Aeromonadales bacterium]|nr:hypothetical protein [Aeromonadales bacterium]